MSVKSSWELVFTCSYAPTLNKSYLIKDILISRQNTYYCGRCIGNSKASSNGVCPSVCLSVRPFVCPSVRNSVPLTRCNIESLGDDIVNKLGLQVHILGPLTSLTPHAPPPLSCQNVEIGDVCHGLTLLLLVKDWILTPLTFGVLIQRAVLRIQRSFHVARTSDIWITGLPISLLSYVGWYVVGLKLLLILYSAICSSNATVTGWSLRFIKIDFFTENVFKIRILILKLELCHTQNPVSNSIIYLNYNLSMRIIYIQS